MLYEVITHTVHGWSFNDTQAPWVRRAYIALERLAARFTDRLVVVSVITSYSIHYTKLYEMARRLGDDPRLRFARVGEDAVIQPVITSYSIHYTKLYDEAFYRLHQADVALLDQIRLGQAITGIGTGNMDHKSQV